jgi:hypothetical protein
VPILEKTNLVRQITAEPRKGNHTSCNWTPIPALLQVT